MNPRRTAMILIPVSIGIGIVGILVGNWPLFALMMVSVAFQAASLVMNRRR
jgi:4-hydroxybenzoate polyprenyltransferase